MKTAASPTPITVMEVHMPVNLHNKSETDSTMK